MNTPNLTDEEQKKISIITPLCEALRDNKEYYTQWQCLIYRFIVEEYNKKAMAGDFEKPNIYQVANKAADNILNWLVSRIAEKEKEVNLGELQKEIDVLLEGETDESLSKWWNENKSKEQQGKDSKPISLVDFVHKKDVKKFYETVERMTKHLKN